MIWNLAYMLWGIHLNPLFSRFRLPYILPHVRIVQNSLWIIYIALVPWDISAWNNQWAKKSKTETFSKFVWDHFIHEGGLYKVYMLYAYFNECRWPQTSTSFMLALTKLVVFWDTWSSLVPAKCRSFTHNVRHHSWCFEDLLQHYYFWSTLILWVDCNSCIEARDTSFGFTKRQDLYTHAHVSASHQLELDAWLRSQIEADGVVMELVVAQVPEIMWSTSAGHGFLHATRSRYKHSDILIGCSAQGRYDFCKSPPIPH